MQATPFVTHEVENQPSEFAPRDLWQDDRALREAVGREGGGGFTDALATYGGLAGDGIYRQSFDAHRDRPRLRSHDRFGHRVDLVEFHPAYHAIMQSAIGHGVAGLSWEGAGAGAHVARAALSYLHYQVEPGSSCPLTMTHAAVPVLRREPGLSDWAGKVSSRVYDPRNVPIADKAGATIGMGMTEKQGGSDVRANTTVASRLQSDKEYSLVGHKWFFSAPMSDGFLVLAQATDGLSCFLMPRWRPDGTRNAFRLMRLKDKLGDWSNASSEVEFTGAWAHRIGDEGRGVATIIEMVMLTRLDCMLGSAGLMRMALAQAMHHCRGRRVFGKALVDQPLMRNVLADLTLEWEAAVALAMRLARAVEAASTDPAEAALARIGTAIGKYWICKRAPAFVNEAQECLGGNGYVEESLLPRLYRQAPLNSIWEGSGNIQCLDVLRALAKEPGTGTALWQQLVAADTGQPDYAAAIATLQAPLTGGAVTAEAQARSLVEQLALTLQASVLLLSCHPAADAFCRARLVAGGSGRSFGSLSASIEYDGLLQRVFANGNEAGL